MARTVQASHTLTDLSNTHTDRSELKANLWHYTAEDTTREMRFGKTVYLACKSLVSNSHDATYEADGYREDATDWHSRMVSLT